LVPYGWYGGKSEFKFGGGGDSGADFQVALEVNTCSSVRESVGLSVGVVGDSVGISVGMVGGSIGLEVGVVDVACFEVGEPIGISVDLFEALGRFESIWAMFS